ncbi:MAG: cyclic nucleotide-binding domain-containing protein [Pseudomonadota bacterium]
MFDTIVSSHILVHAAATIAFIAFLNRNQIGLRLLLLTSNLLYAAYYIFHPVAPLIEAAAWSFAMTASNGTVIVLLLWERLLRPMDAIDRRLYEAFGKPLPGHFRRITRLAERSRADHDHHVLRDGEVPQKIYFMYHGTAQIELGERVILLDQPRFFGELSYVLDQPATGTVRFMAGAEYLIWDRARLTKAFESAPVLRAAFEQFLTRDMARKISDAGRMAEVPSAPAAKVG